MAVYVYPMCAGVLVWSTVAGKRGWRVVTVAGFLVVLPIVSALHSPFCIIPVVSL
jgi:hypothetical protein